MKKNPFTSFVIFPLQLGRVLEEIEVEDLGPEDDLDGVDFTFHDQGFYTQPAGVTQDAPVSSSTRVKDRHCDMLDCFWSQKECFGHGQYYVAMTRVGDEQKVFVHSKDGRSKNIVHQAALR